MLEGPAPTERLQHLLIWPLSWGILVTFAHASIDPPRSWLEPCTALETASSQDLELHKRRNDILKLDVFPFANSGPAIARLVVEPSFDPDWVVSVYHPKDGECRVIATVAEKNVYYANQYVSHRMGAMRRQPAKIGVTAYQAVIPCDDADQIGDAWNAVLSHLVQPNADDPILVDGVAYTAIRITQLGGYTCGRVGSPPEGSPADRLNTLGVKLLDFARAEEADRGEIAIRLRTLAGGLKVAIPPSSGDR